VIVRARLDPSCSFEAIDATHVLILALVEGGSPSVDDDELPPHPGFDVDDDENNTMTDSLFRDCQARGGGVVEPLSIPWWRSCCYR